MYCLAVLGLHCSAQALSRGGEWGPSLLQCVGFSLWRHLWLWSTGSRGVGLSSRSMRTQQLWLAGSRKWAQ